MQVRATGNLRVRNRPSTYNTSTLAIMRKGELARLLSDENAIGQSGQWAHIQYGTVTGYSAAWWLELAKDEPEIPRAPAIPIDYPLSIDNWRGYARALSFDHEPLFIRLPADLPDIGRFSGFGPNVFSWLIRDSTMYAYSQRLHAGLDFGLNYGTPLCAMDWGIVVHASAHDGDNPYGAGPQSVIVRHGGYLTLYGHCSAVRTKTGNIVAPGDMLALSGTFNNWPHLHLEIRRISPSYLASLLVGNDANEILYNANDGFRTVGWLRPNDYFYNPAWFFTTPLESYSFPHAALNEWLDKDANGYIDPYNLYSVRTLQSGGLNWWAVVHS